MSRVFAFTGIPGTGVQEAISRLAKALNPHGRVICLDEELWREFCEWAGRDKELLLCTDLSPEHITQSSRPDWWQLLVLPPMRVRQLWRSAAQRILKSVQALKGETTVLISFHAAYYSDFYRWRFSAVDPKILQEFGFSAFFCLIDDIFDVQNRRKSDLEAERGLVPHSDTDELRFEKLVTLTSDRLDQLIAWRQEEIVLTDHYASFCGAPAHVLAVKHPIQTALRLLNDPSASYYVAHPITTVRGRANFDQTDEYREIVDFLGRVRVGHTIIEPTAIDEFRLKRQETDGASNILPILSPRWPPPEVYLLGETLKRTKHRSIESICADENVKALNLTTFLEGLASGQFRIGGNVLNAVERLESRIAEDITWRDHHLVDQTGQLIVYRPIGYGVPSGGVKREVQYFTKLVQSKAISGLCVIFHPPEDREKDALRVARIIVDYLDTHHDLAGIFRPALSTVKETLVPLITRCLLSRQNPDQLVAEITRKLETVSRLEPQIQGSNPMAPGNVSAVRAEKRRVGKLISGLIVDKLQLEFYIDSLETRFPNDIVITSTVDDVFESLSSHRKGRAHAVRAQ